MPDPAEIASFVTPRTKAIVINSPCNPTGAVFSAALMADICDIARRTGIYIVSDEVYEDIIFEGEHVSGGRASVRRIGFSWFRAFPKLTP